jgi:hypothetical protein
LIISALDLIVVVTAAVIIILLFIKPFRFTQPLNMEIVSGLHDILHKIIETRDKQQF